MSKACTAKKKFFKGKSIGRSQLTAVSQIKPDLMISLGSLGPWASILYEILDILAILDNIVINYAWEWVHFRFLWFLCCLRFTLTCLYHEMFQKRPLRAIFAFQNALFFYRTLFKRTIAPRGLISKVPNPYQWTLLMLNDTQKWKKSSIQFLRGRFIPTNMVNFGISAYFERGHKSN